MEQDCKNLGDVGNDSGSEVGLLQREVDELPVREAGAEVAAAAANFWFRAGTVKRSKGMDVGWEEEGDRVGKSHTYTR